MFRQIVVNKPPRKVMAKYAATLHAELLKAIPWRTPVPHEELILQRFIGSLFFKSATVRIVETTNEHGRIHAHSVTSTARSE